MGWNVNELQGLGLNWVLLMVSIVVVRAVVVRVWRWVCSLFTLGSDADAAPLGCVGCGGSVFAVDYCEGLAKRGVCDE